MAKLSMAEKAALDNRNCASCGVRMVRTYGEALARWRSRRFCSLACTGLAKRQELRSRFFAKVATTPGFGPKGDCHRWTGAVAGNGYGAIQVGGAALGSHRVAWELANGASVPTGLHIMHSCDTPLCVNPAHLSPGLPLANMVDKTEKGRGNAPVGEARPNASISAADAKAIFSDPRKPSIICKDYPISEAMIRRIKARKAWRAATEGA